MSRHLYTPAELAEKFGKGERWLLEQVRAHDWPRVKVGRTIRFTDEQVALILSRHTVSTDRVERVVGLEGQTKRSAGRRSA